MNKFLKVLAFSFLAAQFIGMHEYTIASENVFEIHADGEANQMTHEDLERQEQEIENRLIDLYGQSNEERTVRINDQLSQLELRDRDSYISMPVIISDISILASRNLINSSELSVDAFISILTQTERLKYEIIRGETIYTNYLGEQTDRGAAFADSGVYQLLSWEHCLLEEIGHTNITTDQVVAISELVSNILMRFKETGMSDEPGSGMNHARMEIENRVPGNLREALEQTHYYLNKDNNDIVCYEFN